MPRPSKNGEAARAARKRVLTEFAITKVKPEASGAYNLWDARERGLVLRVQRSGFRSFKFVYSFRGRPRWYHIGWVPLSEARRIAVKLRLSVAEGRDPVAERAAERGAGTFAELADAYLEHAKRKNKSWRQADFLVRRYLLPKWAKLDAKSITRADVRQLMGKIAAPVLANQVCAAASAIFSWAVKQELIAANPCRGVELHAVKSRERVLSDAEIPLLWNAVGDAGLVRSAALKVILLTGQRPGEVCHMRMEHIEGNWWTMPGEPVPELGWPGVKNSATHRVWLSQSVRDIIAELTDGATTGFVFAGARGKPVRVLDEAMRDACAALGIENKVTPHDLRRTFSSKVTELGFGRDAMNRVTNHKEGGIADVYDRHQYADENKRIMEAVASHLLALAGAADADGKVVRASFGRHP